MDGRWPWQGAGAVVRLGGADAASLVDHGENLKGRLHEEWRQTRILRDMDRPLVGERYEIEIAERERQTRPLGSTAGNERRPKELRLRRRGKRGQGRLQHHRLLTWDREQGRDKSVAASDRQRCDVNL